MKSVTQVFLLLPSFYQNVYTDPNTYKQLKWKCQGDEYVVNIVVRAIAKGFSEILLELF